MQESESEQSGRWGVYRLLIFAAIAIVAGRIAVVASPEGDTAFLSANDRSRWCTVASLVERGTYEIDKQISIINPASQNFRPWQTIDKVQHRGDDGQLHSYSSKPPLFPTMVAGIYWLIYQTTGMSMTEHPAYVPRIVLAIVNLTLLAILLWSTVCVIDHLCHSQWGRYAGVIATCFGTMLLPFSITLNNHLPAATAIAVAMGIYFHVAKTLCEAKGDPTKINPPLYMVAGTAVAMAAANELPALSMMVFFIGLFWLMDKTSLAPIMVGVLVVAIGFFGTNWVAHKSLRPPYAHRGNGTSMMTMIKTDDMRVSQPSLKSESLKPELPTKLLDEIERYLQTNQLLAPADSIEVLPSDEEHRWRVVANSRDFALLDQDNHWRLCHWDDWYEYPGSYWQDGNRRGVDLGEPSRATYLFHMTLGHHGIFSLTPIFLLVPIGIILLVRFSPDESKRFALAVFLASIVCMTFYVMRPLIDRNYGGVSACFRWLLWFAPLWLVMVSAALDAWSHLLWWRRFSTALLALSVFSMSCALATPWQSPWLYRYWQFLGWLAS